MTVLLVLLASLVAVAVLMTVTALVARRVGRVVVVDVTWGLGFVLVALVSAALGDEPVRWLLLAMVGVWGLRLAWHVGRRQLAHPEEDPRYAKMLGDRRLRRRGPPRLPRAGRWRCGSSRCRCRWPRSTGTRWTWLVWVGVLSGWSAWSSSRSATPSSRRTRRTRTALR